MRVLAFVIVLVGGVSVYGTELTGRELALLRVVLRQDMQSDVAAAAAATDDVRTERVGPLERALEPCPSVADLNDVMTDETADEQTRLNAARGLAYLGDDRCVETLSQTLAGAFATTSSGFEQSKAGLCLLYLLHDFPPHFLFTHLPNPLFPELNTLLDPPRESWAPLYTTRYDDPNAPYSKDEIEAAFFAWLDAPFDVEIRGPLTVMDMDQRERQLELDMAVASGRWVEMPPWLCWCDWQDFEAEMQSGDLIYYFISDEMSWPGLYGLEGYILVREGQVVDVLITMMS